MQTPAPQMQTQVLGIQIVLTQSARVRSTVRQHHYRTTPHHWDTQPPHFTSIIMMIMIMIMEEEDEDEEDEEEEEEDDDDEKTGSTFPFCSRLEISGSTCLTSSAKKLYSIAKKSASSSVPCVFENDVSIHCCSSLDVSNDGRTRCF
eukprot:m.205961 g.205961  ORF g.205961 m.205961 type:complete len:147 (-) comp32931_c20_seq6:496-936(-)